MKVLKYLSIFTLMLSVAMISGEALAKKKKKKKRKKKKKADSGEVMEHTYPYGMAGCGLGSLVIKDNGMMQVVAATLNGTGVQTFGITTGTSNCELTKGDLARREQEIFLEVNLASLEKEAAQGDGQHLRAFAEVLGCTPQFHDFAAMSQSQHQQIFTSDKADVVLNNYHRAVISNIALRDSCERARI